MLFPATTALGKFRLRYAPPRFAKCTAGPEIDDGGNIQLVQHDVVGVEVIVGEAEGMEVSDT